MPDLQRLIAALLLSSLIGGLGRWRGSLTASGWFGAVLVGTATAGFGGWAWGALVVIFFVTSSALSHWRRDRKAAVADDKFAKTERRDLAQTLANGGVTSLCAVLYHYMPHPALLAAGVGALATVTADTWATELGTLSAGPPRLVTTGRVVRPGTSGGVTVLGMAATVAGALLIGLSAALALAIVDDARAWWIVPAALVGGVAGSLADSLLGATAQVTRWCPRCESETERLLHRCGAPTTQLRGWRWLDNEGVNFVASLVGAGVALLMALAVRHM